MAKIILNMNKVREFTLPNIKTYYGTKVHKNVQYWCKDRQLEQKQTQTHMDTCYVTNGHYRKMMTGQCFY